jgi:hypothetical protein
MGPTTDMVHAGRSLRHWIRRDRDLDRLGFIQADVLSTPFLIGYKELWGPLGPIADTRPPSVLFFAVAH